MGVSMTGILGPRRMGNVVWLLQYGPARHTGPFPGAQVLPPDDEGQDDGVDEVAEGEIEGPEELDATRAVAHLL